MSNCSYCNTPLIEEHIFSTTYKDKKIDQQYCCPNCMQHAYFNSDNFERFQKPPDEIKIEKLTFLTQVDEDTCLVCRRKVSRHSNPAKIIDSQIIEKVVCCRVCLNDFINTPHAFEVFNGQT